MSNYTRRRQMKDSVSLSKSMFRKAEQELAEGYLEVELTGMSARRLLAVYSVLLRGRWSHMIGSLRSRVRPTPAH